MPKYAVLLLLKLVLLPLYSFGSFQSPDEFVQASQNNPLDDYILVKSDSHCSPCIKFESYTYSRRLTKWPRYLKAKKIFIKEDLLGKSRWNAFLAKKKLPEITDTYAVVYLFKTGRLKVHKRASSPWELETLLQ